MVYDRMPADPAFVGIPTFLKLPLVANAEQLAAEKPDVVIVGAPFDMGVTSRPGARYGPRAIRAASNLGRSIHHLELGVQPLRHLRAFDYGDAASVLAAVRGVDAVYLASPGDFPAEPEKRLIDVAKTGSVKKIVKLSAMGVEATDVPLRQVEKHLEGSGLAYAILRPTWFMQNFSTAHAAAIRAGTLAEPAATARTAFIDAPKTRIAVQTVPEWIYGASYPIRLFNRADLLSRFRDRFEFIAGFESYCDAPETIGGVRVCHEGYVLKNRARSNIAG